MKMLFVCEVCGLRYDNKFGCTQCEEECKEWNKCQMIMVNRDQLAVIRKRNKHIADKAIKVDFSFDSRPDEDKRGYLLKLEDVKSMSKTEPYVSYLQKFAMPYLEELDDDGEET